MGDETYVNRKPRISASEKVHLKNAKRPRAINQISNRHIPKPSFSSDMTGGAILRDFHKMAISHDLGRVRRRAYTHCEAEIRGFLLIWVSCPRYLDF